VQRLERIVDAAGAGTAPCDGSTSAQAHNGVLLMVPLCEQDGLARSAVFRCFPLDLLWLCLAQGAFP